MASSDLPAMSGYYPSVALSDKTWDQVIKALQKNGTKSSDKLAAKIDRQVQTHRRDRRDRLENLPVPEKPAAPPPGMPRPGEPTMNLMELP